MVRASTSASRQVPGFASRQIAADILSGVLHHKRPLDEELEATAPALEALDERDRALVRMLVGTVLRRLGTLRALLGAFLERGLPAAPRAEIALFLGAAQILWLEVADHAAVDLSVRLTQADRKALHFSGLVNAVLRRLIREGRDWLAGADAVALDTPAWLMARWTKNYGADLARAIAQANGREPALDLTVKQNPEDWGARLGGRVLPTRSVRLLPRGAVSRLDGYQEGQWWVQDAAASLPARLLGDVSGMRVAELCAAPGGKTAQLALAGARLTAVDRSAPRLARLRENLARLGLSAETIVADATEWGAPAAFDAILLDAPCSSTGTIRRHPDIAWLKRETNVTAMTSLQQRLLDRAAALLRPGGTLVYCVCSLEPEEGEAAVETLLARHSGLRRRPIESAEIFDLAELRTPAGDLRTLPCHLPDAERAMGGIDGFYAARLQRP